MKLKNLITLSVLGLLLSDINGVGLNADVPGKIHVWEMQEVALKAEKNYANFYTDVTCWLELNGPDFSKRIYGFWDGDNIYKVRFVATMPGKWRWRSGSNQP
ncbi:MAG: DUF5060 domain-containing protein, partial [Candidatus Marinimicrobia bacterium]|nr:DUF5060 domain-containing protein [Candidatus Neomarinimicrobiota bacterium]